MSSVLLLPVEGLPEITPGADLAALIAGRSVLVDGDVVVVAQKVVSKAEGALVEVGEDDRAAARARLARTEATRVVAEAPWTVIVETRHGFVCAQAGIDASNVAPGHLALLPDDPDASAARIRDGLRRYAGKTVGVIVADTFGRAWRVGQTDVAIGLAGLPALRDERGGTDRYGAPLTVTQVALADEVAAAADLVRRKADGVPVVIVRGLPDAADAAGTATARDLIRARKEDLFPRGRGMLARALAEDTGPPPDAVRVPVPAVATAAARAAAGELVDVIDEHGVVRLAAHEGAAALVALGAAGAVLRAALLDLGLHGEVEAYGSGGLTIRAVEPPTRTAR